MKVSVVVPCYNEQASIEAVLMTVRNSPAFCQMNYTCELIVVDDCSRDDSWAILKEHPELYDQLLHHDINQGKGAALRTGIKAATGDIVLIQDADFEYDPSDYPQLLAPIASGEADVVYGSRFLTSNYHRAINYWHMMGNRFLTLLSNMLTNIYLTDMETCYKAFRRELIQGIEIEEDRFGFEPEITAKIAKARCDFFEVGVSYRGRSYDEG